MERSTCVRPNSGKQCHVGGPEGWEEHRAGDCAMRGWCHERMSKRITEDLGHHDEEFELQYMCSKKTKKQTKKQY